MTQLEGEIVETLPRGLFRVTLDDGSSLRAGLSREARRFTSLLVPGDRVAIKRSPYDPTRGKITKAL